MGWTTWRDFSLEKIDWSQATVNWWPGYPSTKGLTWPYLPDSGSYSIGGGGAVAPVPQGPAMAVPAAGEPKIEAFVNCELAATEALKHFEQFNPAPWFHCKVAAGERPITSDTLYAAIVKAAPTRPKKFRLTGLDVALRWADRTGVTFTVEGLTTDA